VTERGALITFEGGEGSGKSTQIRMLARRLEAAGLTVRILREPGGTEAGEAIREIVLHMHDLGLDARAELLLYEASRAQLVADVIEPALEAGEIVLCDRFFDSSTAYQGHGRGLPAEEVARLNVAATGGLLPDRTLVLDIDPVLGVSRATSHVAADRIEGEDLAFHERVREGFLAIARNEPERVRVLDASGTTEQVADRIEAELVDVPALASALGSRT
jgi:dTMP kinase